MKDVPTVLAKFAANDMNIHMLTDDVSAVVCKDYNNHFKTPYDTHYIMQGAKVVHVGNLKSIRSFANTLSI